MNPLTQTWSDICTALSPNHIRLLAVSKYTSDESVQTLLHAGQLDFAESRAQNLRDRAIKFPDAQWHFIGPLQKNKAKYVAKYACMWHSLCDLETAQAVAKHIKHRTLPVLIQVNISGETQKQGVQPEALLELCHALSTIKQLKVIGLMGMAAKNVDPTPAFRLLRDMRDDLQQKYGTMSELCMGMSADWKIAAQEGATMVRLGSTLFDLQKHTKTTNKRQAMQHLNITFIGGGNMAEALASGLIKSGHSSNHICVSDINESRLNDLSQRYDIKTNNDNILAIANTDILLLAVKPQQMSSVLTGITEHLTSSTTVISIAAGVSVAHLQQHLQTESDIGLVRVMPNTPALVGAGMSVLFSDANETHKKRAEYVLAASGETAWVDEERHLHAVTAVSGSGPAYFFLLAEVMQAAGESLGLSKDLAARLAYQTALGSGKMLVESGRNATDLRTQVTSPGGTTQAALDEMYENGLPAAVRKGVAAANQRSKELAA